MEDVNLFFNIRDELILRGFEFEGAIQNNLFPALAFEYKHYIHTRKDDKKYLNFTGNDITGIHRLIRRYNVESDNFFEGMTIEGIAHIVQKDPTLLIQSFEDADFEVVDIYEKATSDERASFQPIKEKNVKATVLDTVKLSELFEGGKFQRFLSFCKEKKVRKFSQINIDILEEFCEQPGVGQGKYNAVLQRLKDLQSNKLSHLSNKNVRNVPTVSDRIIYFCDNYLKRVLEANNISYLAFLDDVYAEENYAKLPEKIDQFSKEFPTLKAHAEAVFLQRKVASLRTHILELPIYEELQSFKWAILKDLLEIQLDQGKTIDEDMHLYDIMEDDAYAFIYDRLALQMSSYKPIKQIISEAVQALQGRSFEVLKMRANRLTLEEVGQHFNVTRERARQIEKKCAIKLERMINPKKLDAYIRKCMLEENILFSDKLFDLLTEDEASKTIINYYLSKNEYFRIENDIVFDMEESAYIEQVVRTLYEKEPRILFVEELFQELKTSTEFEVNLGKLDIVMNRLAFRRVNDIYISKSASLMQFITHIFKYKVKGRLEMTDENFVYLNKLMRDTFDIEFESGKRAATARISDTPNIVLVDSNTYVYMDLDTLSEELIEHISEKVEMLLEGKNTITAYTLFASDESFWIQYGIDKPLYLYSIIQHYFKDDYQIGRGNTLSITRLNTKIENATEVLIRLLKQNGNVMIKQDILNDTHWKSYKLEQLIGRNPNFMSVEIDQFKYGVKLFEAYGFTEEELNSVRTFVRTYMTGDYLYTQDLMFEMEFDDQMSALLADKEIYKLYDFASFIKMIVPELRGFTQLIYKKGTAIKTIEEAIFSTYEETLSRQVLGEFLRDKGYSDTTFTAVLRGLLDQQYFYPYTATTYINRQQLTITDGILQALQVYLEHQLEATGYISIYDLVGYHSLPAISTYPWEPFLIAELSKILGYLVVDTVSDYRYNKMLLVHPSLNIQTVDQLAYKLIKEEYEGNYHEQDIATFLKRKNLLHTSNLSNEIKTSPLFEFKEYGFIKLKEV